MLLKKQIKWWGPDDIMMLSCDGRCDKAWGASDRPHVQFDPNEPDDFAYLADHELGTAPADPGTYEGSHGKPSSVPLTPDDTHLMNKWCARACERSALTEPGKPIPATSGLEKRFFNMPWKHKKETAMFDTSGFENCSPICIEFEHPKHGLFRAKRMHPTGWEAIRRPYVGHNGNIVGVTDFTIGISNGPDAALDLCRKKIAELDSQTT
jgi:hypothetical protein